MKSFEIVNKPNQTITITTKKDLTVTQKKAYNLLLKNAEIELKNGYTGDFFNIDITQMVENIGIENKNFEYIKEDLLELKNIRVDITRDKKDWHSFNLLSELEQKDSNLKYALSPSVKEALIKSDFYTPLDLLIMKDLKSKHSLTIYELCKKYHECKKEIAFAIEDFRKLLGIENEYDRYYDLKKWVLNPVEIEINQKTNLQIQFEEVKVSRKITGIKIFANAK